MTKRFHAIVGIILNEPDHNGRTMLDYCREDLPPELTEEKVAEGYARALIDKAPKPPHGVLCLIRLEHW